MALLFTATLPAYAQDCTTPDGYEPEIEYFDADNMYKFCNGTEWVNLVGGGSGADIQPDNFSFTDQTGVTNSTLVSSNILQITGMDNGTSISIAGDGTPAYRICADATCSAAPAYTTSAGTINANQYVQLRLTSNASALTANSATITIGTSSDIWSVTTASYIADTWNPSMTGSKLTLSNSNKTVTVNTGTGWVQCATLSTKSYTSGKLYVETISGPVSGGGYNRMAFAQSTGNISYIQTTYLENISSQVPAVGNKSESGGITNAGGSYAGAAFTNGDRLGWALDLTNGRAWTAVNGTWTNSGDPANNTGGFDITGLTGYSAGSPWHLYWCGYTVGDAMTLVDKDNRNYGIPSGFTYWGE